MAEKEKWLLHSPLMLFICVGFLLFGVVVSEIPLGSKLSVAENNLWVSSNGDFALGFYNPPDQPNQFSVGVRFNSKLIPASKQTVVWGAGADVRASNNSYFQLTQNGELVLFDSSQGGMLWTSKTSQLSIASAQLRDDGNLVLLTEKRQVVWQSFDTPSDTLLPGQQLSPQGMLRGATRNSISSYYSLYMDVSGQLELRWESSIIFWRSGSTSGSNLSAVLTSNGSLQLVDQNLKPLWSVFGQDHNDSVKFRFLRLDVDGNLRMYSWTNVESWRTVWQAVENQCNVFATCDQRGICMFNASGIRVCNCPWYATHSKSKCLVPSRLDCKSASTMVKYENMLLYGIYPVNDSISQMSLEKCKTMCSNDPSCTAITYANNGSAQCRIMSTQYVSGYSDPSLNSVSFAKTCTDPTAADPNFGVNSKPSAFTESNGLCIPCLIGAAVGTLAVFIVVQFGIAFWIYKRSMSCRGMVSLACTGPSSKCLIMLSFSEIKDLTGNFNNQIGPKMFKGVLPNKQLVAIKEMEATIEARKFRAAVSRIGSIHHKSLVKLVGYCCEFNHRYLVYEYAKLGSLEKYVEDSMLCKRLKWGKRMEICLRVGRAVSYLHTGCREFLSHGNLKCENIVLDENFEAKVNEFGLRMLLQGEASSHRSPAEKDVEDFGKMVLMLITGFREVRDVCDWAYKEWMGGNAGEVVDKRLGDAVEYDEVERALRIAFWCLQKDGRARPSMAEVVKVLEGTLSVDPPPPPFACRTPPLEEEGSMESGSET
ncbi:hypothetical protein SLEP1_g41215 [Rubroshorea leprosula]|uniref:Receptor-like serine/threonine-protein kinase n=1 Tax=Rubroshorea leprosula TaxID=152421 RepID=A0AAV5L6R3_9ROSI|nr:hypothetical protein SLEP1_g41215 [Rubroshorea leprosula]